MIRLLRPLPVAALVLGGAYCASVRSTSASLGGRLPLARFGASAPFSYYGGIGDSVRTVVRDSTVWRRVWGTLHRSMHPAPALPRVDFRREMVLVVALGERSSGGWGIVVDSARARQGEVEAFVRRLAPGRHCGVTAAVTAPVDLVRLPVHAGPVRFAERLVVEDCE